MTVFVDDIQTWPSGDWCHMFSDSGPDELHEFAAKLGLKRQWEQPWPVWAGGVHYDITPSKRERAIRMGAQYMSLTDWIKMRRPKLEGDLVQDES